MTYQMPYDLLNRSGYDITMPLVLSAMRDFLHYADDIEDAGHSFSTSLLRNDFYMSADHSDAYADNYEGEEEREFVLAIWSLIGDDYEVYLSERSEERDPEPWVCPSCGTRAASAEILREFDGTEPEWAPRSED